MKIRSLILGGVAGMSLPLALAAPGFAQDSSNPPQYSTPAERQQTQQLNQQGQDGTTQPPAVLNGEAAPGAPTQVQYNGQQQRYQDQQQQYQQQQQQYQDQQDRYHAQRAQYIHDLHRYDIAQYAWTDYPVRAYAYRFHDPEFVHVDTLDRRQLANVPIEGPDGRWVGRIRSVQYSPEGTVSGPIEIALNRRVSVFVNPMDLTYDPRNRVIYTDLTRAQLWAMPGETIETTDYYRP